MGEVVRRAAVTGAGSGIGAALAAILAREGWQVLCIDRDGAAARCVAASLPAAAVAHAALALDVADEAAVVRAFAGAGTLDGLATCAGVADLTPSLEVTADIFRHVHEVNVIGTFLCVREAARSMRPGARICTVASIAGMRGGGLSGTAAYAASKGAVLALTRNLARVLGPRGIAVNTIAPGATETPMLTDALRDEAHRARLEGMTALGRLGSAGEVAEGIAWLLSPRASYVHGATLVADGGLMMQ